MIYWFPALAIGRTFGCG